MKIDFWCRHPKTKKSNIHRLPSHVMLATLAEKGLKGTFANAAHIMNIHLDQVWEIVI